MGKNCGLGARHWGVCRANGSQTWENHNLMNFLTNQEKKEAT